MGVTIKNKDGSIKMGYYSFYRLRTNIASLYSDEFVNFFKNFSEGQYTKEEITEKLKHFHDIGLLKSSDDYVVDFLFSSDLEGKISPKHCRRLYKHIKDYEDNVQYGKASRQVSFNDFKNVVYQCAKNRWVLTWS